MRCSYLVSPNTSPSALPALFFQNQLLQRQVHIVRNAIHVAFLLKKCISAKRQYKFGNVRT
ncbi:protein of unknown function [Magnetospirillum gryphiswaldense MSR-1 v2]|uniref:Uncharacterized protein n=1 Tax=Magnetospirillum gryphiswaldense (strain DSM 6361 / JCM 21280 / NBRC 15271 / MSR-1) TaxID=431944 RepID=V6EZ09_MAGGM|nr:protein of unknown function [Magnetospirillum gryphiswaldense MSR-1 v2]